MDKDFKKIVEGLNGAYNVLNKTLTKEVLEQMTPAQKAEVEKANPLQSLKDIEDSMNKITF